MRGVINPNLKMLDIQVQSDKQSVLNWRIKG